MAEDDLINYIGLWCEKLPVPAVDGHKYDRGHIIVRGGARMTGAARLVAAASMRMGAGLCTIVADRRALPLYQVSLPPHIMAESVSAQQDFSENLRDERRNAIVIGPGAGLEVPERLRQEVLGVLETGRAAVLDGDALSCFEGQAALLEMHLRDYAHDKIVLTPHEGEFARIFPDIEGARAVRARAAAEQSGAVIVLKGADTVIAAPGQEPAINVHATPYLATAGAGDVLAGMIGGLMAQGMDGFYAACAAVWIHGEAGIRRGQGLVAPDIIEEIPAIMKEIT